MDARMLQQLQAMQRGGGAAMGSDAPLLDTAETVYVSSLALLKMLKHGRAGVPFEVMGLMLGEFVDDYTVKVVDVFAMPQRGTSMTVEAVDPVFQTDMAEALKQTGRHEVVVGWYHSHPGWGCWLSGVDINTQQSFEQLNSRNVAVVVDPVISVKGKVAIDAFRSINPQLAMLGQPSRQTTSVLTYLKKPSIQALVHGLNRQYYSMVISFRKNELEEKMLMNLNRKNWKSGLHVKSQEKVNEFNVKVLGDMVDLMDGYAKDIDEENEKTSSELVVSRVGKVDAKKRLQDGVESLMVANILQVMGTMMDVVVF